MAALTLFHEIWETIMNDNLKLAAIVVGVLAFFTLIFWLAWEDSKTTKWKNVCVENVVVPTLRYDNVREVYVPDTETRCVRYELQCVIGRDKAPCPPRPGSEQGW